jgi:hypothetical protein
VRVTSAERSEPVDAGDSDLRRSMSSLAPGERVDPRSGQKARAVLAVLALIGCATTSAEERLAESCRQDPSRDERCVEVLTREGEEYESRAQVMEKEAQREARAFDDRLARLRREEEQRQAERAKSSTIAVEPVPTEDPEELPEEAKDLAGAKPAGPGGLEVGSSVRALEKEAPTPEAYLRGARCVLAEDLAELRKAFEAGKRAPEPSPSGSRALPARDPQIAVVILDSEQLVARIDAEMKHRRLPHHDGECKQHRQVIEVLRALVGPRVDGRALGRLSKELERRAGLPLAE